MEPLGLGKATLKWWFSHAWWRLVALLPRRLLTLHKRYCCRRNHWAASLQAKSTPRGWHSTQQGADEGERS